MLGIVLGFSGRIGRLRYFLLSLLVMFTAAALILAIVLAVAFHGASTGPNPDAKDRAQTLCLFIVLPFFTWFSLALQAKRIRDIGWPPLIVISAWVAAVVADAVVVRAGLLQPAAGHNGTAFGMIVNLAMGSALLFWPSCKPEAWTPPSGRLDPSRSLTPEPRSPSIPIRNDPSAPIAFGRRGRA